MCIVFMSLSRLCLAKSDFVGAGEFLALSPLVVLVEQSPNFCLRRSNSGTYQAEIATPACYNALRRAGTGAYGPRNDMPF